jgi:type III secretory pathway component EscV
MLSTVSNTILQVSPERSWCSSLGTKCRVQLQTSDPIMWWESKAHVSFSHISKMCVLYILLRSVETILYFILCMQKEEKERNQTQWKHMDLSSNFRHQKKSNCGKQNSTTPTQLPALVYMPYIIHSEQDSRIWRVRHSCDYIRWYKTPFPCLYEKVRHLRTS